MVFSSMLFLYLFLGASVALYFLAPGLRLKNWILTVLSLFFYAWGEPVWVVLLLFSSLLDYTCGRVIGRYRGLWQAKAALCASVVINLSLLATFKYLDFLVGNLNLLTGAALPLPHLMLPIGISFYTFQTLSYTLDVYRSRVGVQKSLVSFVLFVSLFPQLIAGPIVRYEHIEAELAGRKTTWAGAAYGLRRFAVGLAKKVLIANVAAELADTLLLGDLDILPGGKAWLGMLTFAFQIYFDFSGYSDMAIGLGRLFGFTYPENFRHPYISRSITEFWRRWHISLGTFFRDYVYIPMGGNRRHQIPNLLVVWFLTGLWHGASWNFVLWGLYYCALLMLEKFVFKDSLERLPTLVRQALCFFLVLVGWSLFYYTDFYQLGQFWRAALGVNAAGFFGGGALTAWLENLPLLLLCFIGATEIPARLGRRIPARIAEPLTPAYNLALLALCTIALVGQSYNPFIYFRF